MNYKNSTLFPHLALLFQGVTNSSTSLKGVLKPLYSSTKPCKEERTFPPTPTASETCASASFATRAKVHCLLSSAQGEIRTRTPVGATPSRWCVCQFRHLGLKECKFKIFEQMAARPVYIISEIRLPYFCINKL